MDLNTFQKRDKDDIEVRDLKDAIRTLVQTNEGKKFFKYLLTEFNVNDLPPVGFEGALLHEYIGFCRAGSSLFDIFFDVCPYETALIMAEISKERKQDV